MAQVIVPDLDSATLKKLKQRAEANHRSLQRELHLILSQAVSAESSDTRAKRPSKSAPRRRATKMPPNSVWAWLKRPSTGKLSKEHIDSYIRAERKSWGSS